MVSCFFFFCCEPYGFQCDGLDVRIAGDIFAQTEGERVGLAVISKMSMFQNHPRELHPSKSACTALQVYCIFLFLCAASLFGTIIAQVNEIVASVTVKKKDLDSILEVYLNIHPRCSSYILKSSFNIQYFLRLNKCCCSLGSRTMFDVRNWERFQFFLDCDHQNVSINSIAISTKLFRQN